MTKHFRVENLAWTHQAHSQVCDLPLRETVTGLPNELEPKGGIRRALAAEYGFEPVYFTYTQLTDDELDQHFVRLANNRDWPRGMEAESMHFMVYDPIYGLGDKGPNKVYVEIDLTQHEGEDLYDVIVDNLNAQHRAAFSGFARFEIISDPKVIETLEPISEWMFEIGK
jgi:hypothetical protein